jgi:hypothetical protein
MFALPAVPLTVMNSTEASNTSHINCSSCSPLMPLPKPTQSQFQVLEVAKHILKQAHIATNRIPILLTVAAPPNSETKTRQHCKFKHWQCRKLRTALSPQHTWTQTNPPITWYTANVEKTFLRKPYRGSRAKMHGTVSTVVTSRTGALIRSQSFISF